MSALRSARCGPKVVCIAVPVPAGVLDPDAETVHLLYSMFLVSLEVTHGLSTHSTCVDQCERQTGLAGFARGLVAAGVEIYSTGGTRKHLESEGIAVRDVSEYTGFPEMMDGRLRPSIPRSTAESSAATTTPRT